MEQERQYGSEPSAEGYKERISDFSRQFELGLFISLARKSLGWVLAFFIICALGAFLYLRYTPRIYTATSVIQIKNDNNASRVLQVEDVYESRSINAELEVLKSKEFVKRIMKDLPLEVSYHTEGELLTYENYQASPYRVNALIKDSSVFGQKFYIDFAGLNKASIRFRDKGEMIVKEVDLSESIQLPKVDLEIFITNYEAIRNRENTLNKGEFFFVLNDREKMVNELLRKMSFRVSNEAARAVSVSFTDGNGKKAADISNALAQGYIEYDLEKKIESSDRILRFIDSQIDQVFEKLKTSEMSIQEFKIDNKLAQTEDFTGIYLERQRAFEDELIQIEMELSLLQQIKEATTSKDGKSIDVYNLLPLLAGTKFENNLSRQVAALHDLLLEKEQKLYEVTASSGIIKNLDYQISVQKKLLMQSIASFQKKLSARRESISAKIEEIDKTFSSLPAKELIFSRLKRSYSINEKFYTLLIEKKAEYSISKAGIVSDNTILELAQSPKIPTAPNKTMVVVIFMLLAIILSISLVLIRYLVFNDISSLNEIVKLTHASVGTLGIVPRYKENIPVSQLVVDKRPKSVLAESFRTIRTNLQFMNSKDGAKTIAITSTISGEGKTFVAINLAGIIAFSGKKVIILDLDMRKPKIHLGFGVGNEKGMSSLLVGMEEIETCVQHSSQDGLDFITAGPTPPNPSELIINGKLDEIIEDLKGKYDVVIIDNPPVGLVTDGIYCLQMADYPIYIFRAHYSKRHFVQNVDRIVNENQLNRLSVILNGADIAKGGYNYGYGYGYGYGYDYGYGYGYGYTYGGGYYEEAGKSKKRPWYKRLIGR